MPKGIAFDLHEYIQLVDWTGRQIRDDKRGSIASDALPIIQRINISTDQWLNLCTHFESRFKGLVGSVNSLTNLYSQSSLHPGPDIGHELLRPKNPFANSSPEISALLPFTPSFVYSKSLAATNSASSAESVGRVDRVIH